MGGNILYVGGSDGETPQSTVFVAQAIPVGNFGAWEQGPALPEPRSDATVLVEGGNVYVFGGLDADGNPTDTVYVMKPNAETGALSEWEAAEESLTLPEPRAGAGIAATADGSSSLGGTGPDGVSGKAWQAAFNAQGTLDEWKEVAQLSVAVTDATIVSTGTYVWLYGGGETTASRSRRSSAASSDCRRSRVSRRIPMRAWSWPGPPRRKRTCPHHGRTPRAGAQAAPCTSSAEAMGRPRGPRRTGRSLTASGNIPEWKHLDVSDLPPPVSRVPRHCSPDRTWS